MVDPTAVSTGGTGGVGMAADPISAVANAVGSIFDTIGIALAPRKARWENLPEWLSPADFQQQDYTIETILGGIAVAFVILVIVIAVIAVRK